jgi:hypothetical protein
MMMMMRMMMTMMLMIYPHVDRKVIPLCIYTYWNV